MPTNQYTYFDHKMGQFVTKTASRKFLTPEERQLIWKLRKRQLSIHYIAKRLKCSTRTVSHWIHKFAEVEGQQFYDMRKINDRIRLAARKAIKQIKHSRWPVIEYLRRKFEETNDIRWLPTNISDFDRYNTFTVRLLGGPPF